MGCCGKTVKRVRNIAIGLSGHAIEKMTGIAVMKYEFTDDRIRACQKCEHNYWRGRTLWCGICKCFVPGKARIADEKCPEGKWDSGGR